MGTWPWRTPSATPCTCSTPPTPTAPRRSWLSPCGSSAAASPARTPNRTKPGDRRRSTGKSSISGTSTRPTSEEGAVAVLYGGEPLTFPAGPAQAWVEANITLADVLEFGNPRGCPWPTGLVDGPVRLGRLFWPRGASRFARFHFLATDPQLARIRSQAYSAARPGRY